MSNLAIITGDTKKENIFFKDDEGSPIDITGATVFFTLKPRTALADSDDSNAAIEKTITEHTDPTVGKTLLDITAEETATLNPSVDYVYDIQIKYSNGEIASTLQQLCEVFNDITKRTS